MFSIVLIQIAQKLLRDHVGLSDLPSLCAVSCKQMLVRRLKQKAVKQSGRPALIVVLPAVVALHCRMQLRFEFSAGQMKLLRQAGLRSRGITGIQIIADQTFPPFFRQQRHRLPVVCSPVHIGMREMRVIIVAGGLLKALMRQARLQQEEISRAQVIPNAVLLQIQIPVPDHIQDPFVDAAGKMDPRLVIPDLSQHPHLREQICIVGYQHTSSPIVNQTAVQ